MSALAIFAAHSYGGQIAMTGGRLRRDHLLDALERRGHHVDRLTLTSTPGAGSAMQGAWRSLVGDVRRRAATADVVLLGDVFCVPMLPAITRTGTPVVVDVVDSPYRFVRGAPRRTARERMAALAQTAQLLPVMKVLLPMADGVTYISAEDERVDAATVRRLPPTGIVPNGVHPDLFAAPLTAPPADGYVAWLADWAYAPNRESLAWFAREVAPRLSDDHLAELRLFGSGDSFGALGRDAGGDRMRRLVRHAGFVESLVAVYHGARLVVAPVVRGTGVNNKVLEPLAAGRPTVTTEVGARGLPADIRQHLQITATPAEMAAQIAADPPPDGYDADRARAAVARLSWDGAAEAMEAQLRQVIRLRTPTGAGRS